MARMILEFDTDDESDRFESVCAVNGRELSYALSWVTETLLADIDQPGGNQYAEDLLRSLYERLDESDIPKELVS